MRRIQYRYICNVQSGSKKESRRVSWTRAERSERSERSARARGEKFGQKNGRERAEEKKKEEGEEDEGFVEKKAFRVGVARWASRLPRRECG